MPKWITTESRKWKEVEQGETIETPSGQRFEVLSTRKGKAKGTRTVVIRGKGGTFTKTVESKKKTSVVMTDGKSGGKGTDLEKLRAENEERAARRSRPTYGKAQEVHERSSDPWKVDPADTLYAKAEGQVVKGNGGPWDKAQDAAEERAVDILGARLLGIQKEPGGIYHVPTIDRTAIRAHLFVMHGKDLPATEETDLLVLHATEHERPPGDLYVPHEHTATRP